MEDRYTETYTTWNKIASLYEEKFMKLELYNDTYQKFCDLLPKPDASVLEIGCGPGNITQQILGINPSLRVLATDVSKNMIELAKRNNPHVDAQVFDARNLRRLDKSFDGIICGFTIPYLSKSDCSEFITNCSDLLNENGILYVSFVYGDYNQSGFVKGSSSDRVYFYYHTFEQIKRDLERNQLTVVDVTEKEYQKSDDTQEKHIIVHAKKRACIRSHQQ